MVGISTLLLKVKLKLYYCCPCMRHEGVWWSKRIAPPILNFNIRRRWVGDQLHAPSAYTPRETAPADYWTACWVALGMIWPVLRRDKLLGSTGIRTRIVSVPNLCLLLWQTKLSLKFSIKTHSPHPFRNTSCQLKMNSKHRMTKASYLAVLRSCMQ